VAEARPHSAARGYDRAWRKRQAAHLERVRIRQEAEGLPGGPWCECQACRRVCVANSDAREIETAFAQIEDQVLALPPGVTFSYIMARPEPADTVDHYPRPLRAFPLELQGSEEVGGSDHPSNLRAMSHSHHSRRTEDKARKRRI
jgi:hypothetical protein